MANAVDNNTKFLMGALEKNYSMPAYPISQAGQVIDIELDSVPGWAKAIDLSCLFDMAITVGAGGTAPTASQFAPWNFFRKVEIQLGGGPFQNVNPYFYYLREMVSQRGWNPNATGPVSYPYTQSAAFNIPTVSAPAGATTDNIYRFSIRIPLQTQHGSVYGLIPLGNAATKMKVRITLANTFIGADTYLFPFNGGTNVTSINIGSNTPSWVQPNILYYTSPATPGYELPNPQIGMILNVQEKATSFVGTGALTPVKFPDPFRYLRLWHLVIDGTGAPNSAAVTNFEMDLTPGYPQYNFKAPGEMMQYFNLTRRRYGQDLPTGVFLHDFWAGSDPANPNGTQTIDATIFQTMQSQIQVASGTNVTAGMAKIITFAEALSPIAF